MKPSLEQIDLLLGESLELMQKAAKEIKEISSPELRNKLVHVGKATTEIWEVRDQIYKLKPGIKRDFIFEYSQDKQRFGSLSQLHVQASEAESAGKYDEAKKAYSELLEISNYGYFKLLAEAGLHRVTKKNN